MVNFGIIWALFIGLSLCTSATNNKRREPLCILVIRPSVRCPSSVCHVMRGISMTLGTNVPHVSGHCWRDFQGQRSKVKVIARWNALFWRRDKRRLTAVRLLSVAMVSAEGSSRSADSQPKSVGLVWGLAATRRSICIHQMNRVNSRNDCVMMTAP